MAWVCANELVWKYVLANYMLDENPPASDVLAWHVDGTNLPATLHAEMMNIWLDNALLQPGTLEVLGTKIDLGAVTTDLYAVGALDDRLVPWQSTYAATAAFGAQ